jgi:hypothetical protein
VGVAIKEDEKHKHKIIITEGDKVKTIFVEEPVIIKEGKERNFYIVSPDGKYFFFMSNRFLPQENGRPS